MPVHRRNAHHHHIDLQKIFIIRSIVVKYHGDKIAQPPVAQLTLIGRTMPAVIGEMLLALITLRHLDRSFYDQISAYLHILQFIPAPRQSPVQKHRHAEIARIVHPVAALYHPHCLIRRNELRSVLSLKIVQHRTTLRFKHFFFQISCSTNSPPSSGTPLRHSDSPLSWTAPVYRVR